LDSSGNIFIADTGNNVIREVTASTGDISTVAGTGVVGYTGDNDAATSATLNSPDGVAVDSSGNIFIADTGNNVIREVKASSGIITTIAGTMTSSGMGAVGYTGDNGLAISATLSGPQSIVLGSSGNIYFSDSGNSVIRKITASSGVITTFAGNGSYGYSGDNGAATSATLEHPDGVALDSSGNLYIADVGNMVIRKVTASSGVITTVAGDGQYGDSGDNGAASSAMLFDPHGVAVDSAGNIYIADTLNSVIRKVAASSGVITTVAGNGTAGYSGDTKSATSANLSNPWGVAVDSAGNIYVADTGNSAIRKVTF
jgi:sugar lactone lactonase YvrE